MMAMKCHVAHTKVLPVIMSAPLKVILKVHSMYIPYYDKTLGQQIAIDLMKNFTNSYVDETCHNIYVEHKVAIKYKC